MKPSELLQKEFIQSVEEHLLKEPLADDDIEIEYVDARQFLTSERIDLVCKMYYIECREKNRDLKFARELYAANIRAITGGQFKEEWNPVKNGLDKYFEIFDKLIDDIKANGFDPQKSVIPVSEDCNILDGAHRTAIAAYFGIPLPIIRLKVKGWGNNYRSFLNDSPNTMPESYVDFMAYQYMKYKEPCYVAFVWPISYIDPNYEIALKLIEQNSNIVYKKTIQMNYSGFTQLVMHNYMDTKWAKGLENRLPNIYEVVDERYAPNAPITVMVLDGKSLKEIVQLKQTVRTVLHEGFGKIHITDTQWEALRMAKMILNPNSIAFLNQANFFRYDSFIDEFFEFRKTVLENHLEDEVCLDTGDVLGVYGLRETRDIDYVSRNNEDINALREYDRHTQEYYNNFLDEIDCKEIIENWFHHFYCFDIMFASIESVKKFKAFRNEPKDQKDIALIQAMQTGSPYRYVEPEKPKKVRFLRVKRFILRVKRNVYRTLHGLK